MNRATASLVLAALFLPTPTYADFEVIDQRIIETSTGQAFGITTNGTDWFVAQPFTNQWDVFDREFAYLSTTTAASGTQFRGVSYAASRGSMFTADYATGDVGEFTLDGELIGAFTAAAPGQLTAVSVHRLDDTIWVATFDGAITQFDLDGNQLAGFTVPFFVTGLAIDEAAGTLLLMESNDDLVHEYRADGAAIGLAVPIDLIPRNGLGLYYDAYTATLYATTQAGPSRVTIFQDAERPVLDNEPDCPADCNADGALNKLDFICFMMAWKSREERADCNTDGAHNILDFVCYQNQFRAGCGEAGPTNDLKQCWRSDSRRSRVIKRSFAKQRKGARTGRRCR